MFAPTLTGLGERAQLLDKTVNLSTHIEDICRLIRAEQLSDIVLVGHSYGGMVVSGVADRMPERLGALVIPGHEAMVDAPELLADVLEIVMSIVAWERFFGLPALQIPIPGPNTESARGSRRIRSGNPRRAHAAPVLKTDIATRGPRISAMSRTAIFPSAIRSRTWAR